MTGRAHENQLMGKMPVQLAYDRLQGDDAALGDLGAEMERQAKTGGRELFDLNDFKTILRIVEVYHTMDRMATCIDVVAEKLSHVIVKIS